MNSLTVNGMPVIIHKYETTLKKPCFHLQALPNMAKEEFEMEESAEEVRETAKKKNCAHENYFIPLLIVGLDKFSRTYTMWPMPKWMRQRNKIPFHKQKWKCCLRSITFR